MTKKQHILLLIPIILFTITTVFLFSSPSVNHGRAYNNDRLIRQEANASRFGSYVGDGEGNYSISGFSGIKDIYYLTVDTEYEVLSYSCTIKLERGLFKVVLVTESGDVITLVENGGTVFQQIELTKGKHRIKIVGKSASVDFAFSPTTPADTIRIEKSKL